MRIDAYNTIGQMYKTNNVRKTGKQQAAQPTDTFVISQEAKDYQTARMAVKEAADIRQDVVTDIKKRMDAGTYNVSTDDLADKMMAEFMG